ncbi:MAG: amino acid adenylation domain-containing protein, partial [Methanococcaceae archaeon]
MKNAQVINTETIDKNDLLAKDEGNDIIGYFPLSYSQQRLWFLYHLDPENPIYNIPVAIRIQGKIDLNILTRCFNEIFHRHEILRTSFIQINGTPLQAIHSGRRANVNIIDLSVNAEDKDRESLAIQMIGELTLKAFNLNGESLLKTTLFKLEKESSILFLLMHHIITDAWSMKVLAHEIMILYNTFAVNSLHHLPPLKIQYADYAVWQKKWMSSGKMEKQLVYWKEKLSGSDPTLNLCPNNNSFAQSDKGMQKIISLNDIDFRKLRRMYEHLQVTGFMHFLGLFSLLLMRYSGKRDLCLGVPVSNRPSSDTEAIIGFFVNTIVMRIKAVGNYQFSSFMQEIKENTLQAFANQHLPFDYLVETLQPDRQIHNNPLFNIMFSYQADYSDVTVKTGNITFEPIELHNGLSAFDLTFSVYERNNSINIAAEYKTSKYDDCFIDGLLESFQVLIKYVLENPDSSINDIPLVSQSSEDTLLRKWNHPLRKVPEPVSIKELFEKQARKTPDKVALVFKGQFTTYSMLNTRANQLARYLIRKGVKKGDFVGICLESSDLMITGILSIIKAGAAYIPLDPNNPDDRLRYIVDDSGVNIVITSNKFSEKFGEKRDLILLEKEWNFIIKENSKDIKLSIDPLNALYVIYTSGTTGNPKGVVVSNLSVVNHNLSITREYGLTSEDSVLQFSAITFDVSVEEIFPTLIAGAKLVLYDKKRTLSIEELIRLINTCQITIIGIPTSYWDVLVSELSQKNEHLPLSLRLVVTGSEKFNTNKFKDWLCVRNNYTHLINAYGPTETTITSTVFELKKDHYSDIPIGHPICNARTYILDTALQLLPAGAAGELYIGGIPVALGYMNRPDLTAERFLPDPFTNTPGARMYKSGDLVRYRRDGELEIFGRIDDQIKIRGYRIEPQEVTDRLLQHPEISTALVVPVEDKNGGIKLAAYYVLNAKHAGHGSEIRPGLKEYLKATLADYMVPSVFIQLDKMPLNSNGKINRKELPAPELHQPEPSGKIMVSPVEEVLINIWQQLLPGNVIITESNFFDLGGHSLLLIRMSSQIKQVFGIEIPLKEIFEHPTPRAIAKNIIDYKTKNITNDIIPIERVSRDGKLPLSFAQQRLWFLDQLQEGSNLYNIPSVFHIQGNLKIGYLRESVFSMLKRHEILRSRILTEDGIPRMEIMEIDDFELPVIEIPQGIDQENRINDVINEMTRYYFKLNIAPLMKVLIIKTNAAEHYLLITFHHIIADEWSLKIYMDELLHYYKAYSENIPVSLNELTFQYSDYAAWQRKYLQGDIFNSMIDYWKQKLNRGNFELVLPKTNEENGNDSNQGDAFSFKFSENFVIALKEFTSSKKVTLYMTMLGGLGVLLYRYSGQEDISIGSPVANR